VTSTSVRDATPGDAGRIAEVARRSWTDTYRDIFEPAYIDDFLERAYAPSNLAAHAAAAAAADDRHFLVAERDGRVVAFAEYGVGPRGPELFRIYADPAHYGSGAGHALVVELERRLDGAVESYVLDVHAENARGRAFYDRHGFVVAGAAASPDCHLAMRRILRPRRVRLPIETDRLRMRGWQDDDADALHAIYGDPATMRYIGAAGRPTPDAAGTLRVMDALRRHEAVHGFTIWPIDELDGERLIAVAGLTWVETHGPEVEAAYLVRCDRWGRGYATEALRAVLAIGREQLGLDRIVALAYPDNHASRRVMEKAGMRAEGTMAAYGRELTRHVWP
jgi:[ribosomal protein S5]-alanine N-acetyltransferase